MEINTNHPSRTKVSLIASKPSKIIGAATLASGMPSPKLLPPSGPALLARMTSSVHLQAAPTSQCLTNMTTSSPGPAIVASKEGINMKIPLAERLSPSVLGPGVVPRNLNVAKSTKLSTHGKSVRKLTPSLYQRIWNKPAPWSETTPLTSSMHSGHSSPLNLFPRSQSPNGTMFSPEQRSTLTLSSPAFSPVSPKTRSPPPLGILTFPSAVANHPKPSNPTATGLLPGMPPP